MSATHHASRTGLAFTFTFALGAALAPALVPALADGPVIGLDDRNGFNADSLLGTGADFEEFRALIVDLGMEIRVVDDYTPEELDGLDALMVMNPYADDQQFTGDDLDAIDAHVAAGGGLWIVGEGGGDAADFVGNLNALTGQFGVIYLIDEIDGAGRIVSGFRDHPVTEGVSSVGLDLQRGMGLIFSPAQDLTFGNGAEDILAVVDGIDGRGSVVLTTDSSTFTDSDTRADFNIGDLDNALLVRNILETLTGGAEAGLELVKAGCPTGPAAITVNGATPNGTVALLFSSEAGTFEIPDGFTCAGTTLDLAAPVSIGGTFTADADGTVGPLTASAAACNVVIQALDVTTCATSSAE